MDPDRSMPRKDCNRTTYLPMEIFTVCDSSEREFFFENPTHPPAIDRSIDGSIGWMDGLIDRSDGWTLALPEADGCGWKRGRGVK